MSAFADASALVKLYVEEDHHAWVRTIGGLVVAQVSRVEVPAALWRKTRTGDLDAADAVLLVDALEADWFGAPGAPARFAVVAATDEVLDHAARLTGSRGLRAYDAVQLASALALASADPGSRVFVAFDRALREAATAEGLSTPRPT